jgi:preprotein translocase subunit SecA
MQLGAYPERRVPESNWLERSWAQLAGLIAARSGSRMRRMRRFTRRVNKAGDGLPLLSERELKTRVSDLRQHLHRDGLLDKHTVEAFALVREVSRRVLGKPHYDVQIMGGWAMVQGALAEMETGEGKTLTATLPACTAALAGIPVHVITVNDYLVSRDAANMKPVYDFLGLTVGTIVEGMEEHKRRAAYAADITYCTNKQLAFDYLRDRIVLRKAPGRLTLQMEKLYQDTARLDQLLMRGLCFAIVDEADSALIDEAGTPLIISGQGNTSDELSGAYVQAMELAERLHENRDFVIHRRERRIRLTPHGMDVLVEQARKLRGQWTLKTRREELVTQALAALHLFRRDREYLVRDNSVQIIDDFTGRIMADRKWERGLHQMIEVKEGCEISSPNEALARITYQRFFKRYLHLAGMTGTASEAAGELSAVYGLKVIKIPARVPSRLAAHPDRIYATAEAKWNAVVERVRAVNEQERPVLVGSRSVDDSERVSALLTEADLPHLVLNARQDRGEAFLVECAGQSGCITVATNMAGRGTDIPLGEGVAESGGLHVIAVERNEARRIDRQLFGRSARQGAPGSYESILSLEDEIIARFFPKYLRALVIAGARGAVPLSRWRIRLLIALCQFRSERAARFQRRELERMDEQLGRLLAYTGQPE